MRIQEAFIYKRKSIVIYYIIIKGASVIEIKAESEIGETVTAKAL